MTRRDAALAAAALVAAALLVALVWAAIHMVPAG